MYPDYGRCEREGHGSTESSACIMKRFGLITSMQSFVALCFFSLHETSTWIRFASCRPRAHHSKDFGTLWAHQTDNVDLCDTTCRNLLLGIVSARRGHGCHDLVMSELGGLSTPAGGKPMIRDSLWHMGRYRRKLTFSPPDHASDRTYVKDRLQC